MDQRPVHFEIQVDDVERAKKFYENVLGWKIEKSTMPDVGMDYWMIDTGKSSPGINGGLLKRPDNPHKMNSLYCTVAVNDMDKVIEAVKANGGKVNPWQGQEKWEMKGLGWFSNITDGEGNTFGLLQPMDWKPNM